MFGHDRHRKDGSDAPIATPPVRTVRVLQGDEELQAALERAKVFESRRFDDYKRRIGTYDRFINQGRSYAAELEAESTAEAS